MSTGITRDDGFFREILADSAHGVFSIDPSGQIVFSNGILEEYLGVDSEGIHEKPIDDLCAGDDPSGRIRDASSSPGETVTFTLRDGEGRRVPIAATCETIDFDDSTYFTVWFRERVVGDEKSCETAVADRGEPTDLAVRDVAKLGRDLIAARDPETVAEVTVDAVSRMLGTDVACVRLFDGGTNALELAATTDGAAELLASRPAFDLNASLAGRAFRRGEPVFDRPDATGDVVERPNLHVPLGKQGTLTVFESGRTLPTADVDTLEHLAAMVASRLEQVADGRRSGTGSADVFDLPLLDLVGDVATESTREDIGAAVCERLTAAGEYSGAWYVSVDADGEWRSVEASAGDVDPFAQGGGWPTEGTDGDDPVSRTVETGDVCIVSRRERVTSGADDDGPARRNETVETTAAVPISRGDRTYGVVVLHSDSDRADTPGRRAELEIVGDVVGLAAYGAESKKLLLSEKVQQVEFEVTDRDCLAVAVSAETDSFCEVEHRTLRNDGNHLCYLRVEDVPPERACEAASDHRTVADCRVVDSDTDTCLLEVVKTRSGAEAMMSVGATVHCATASEGVGTLVVNAPISADVREVVDAYTTLNPDSRLVAKREIDRPVATTDVLRERIDDLLTDRQQSVLTSAYYAGYFEWPRLNTAEEVADSLGISPATLHQHLRTAERKLLDAVCDDRANVRDRQPTEG